MVHVSRVKLVDIYGYRYFLYKKQLCHSKLAGQANILHRYNKTKTEKIDWVLCAMAPNRNRPKKNEEEEQSKGS